MFAFTSILALTATFVITQVAGNPADTIHELIARQSSGINPSAFPTECHDQCAPLVTALGNNCSSIDCICGSSVANNVLACWQCGAGTVGVGNAQTAYNAYAHGCSAANHSVPAFTAIGSSGGSSGSSNNTVSSGSSNSTGSSGSSGTTGSSGTGGASRIQAAGVGVVAAIAALLLAV